MDKYEELKQYISSKILECQNELEKENWLNEAYIFIE